MEMNMREFIFRIHIDELVFYANFSNILAISMPLFRIQRKQKCKYKITVPSVNIVLRDVNNVHRDVNNVLRDVNNVLRDVNNVLRDVNNVLRDVKHIRRLLEIY
jgi:uncharacterized protein YoxC